MKMNLPMLCLIAIVGMALVVPMTGCPTDEPEVIDATFEELPEAAEEVYTDEPEEPGTEELPGLPVEEMVDDTPAHVDEEAHDEAELE